MDQPVPEFPPDVQFLIFMQPSGAVTPMTTAQDMRLNQVAFVRYVQISGCQGGPRSAVENAFDVVVNGPEIKVKPGPKREETAIAVPASPLEPGLYQLSGGSLHSSVMFSVSPLD
jgi:hypothetical protein